jgi:serine/threonine protein kinase
VGTQIGGLEITGLIGEGGFGVVYLAFDATLQRQVALKEYMPSSLASRSVSGTDVSVKAGRYAETFAAGLRSFVNEARLLAHFDHPALVKVHQFWQANRTAYMVMPYYQGPTLKAHLGALAAQGKTPDEATLRQWLVPLLDALELMHSEQCYHRDVAPDNILLTANGPLLLDFGAARRVISDMTHALTVMLKPGYAPIEQYGDAASMAQGPWTDLYALGSVIYFAITGHSPITSVERVMGDPLPALANVAAGRYSASFLRAIDAALAVRPKDRPQSVAEFRALLQSAEPVARLRHPASRRQMSGRCRAWLQGRLVAGCSWAASWRAPSQSRLWQRSWRAGPMRPGWPTPPRRPRRRLRCHRRQAR